MSELKKIITDGKNKYKAFDEADKALKEFEGLGQASRDLSKVVAGLEKTRDSLKAEASELGGKIEAAQVKAADIVAKAEAQATAAIEAAQDTIAVNQSKADKKLLDINDRISTQERAAIIADGKAKEAQAKLDELSVALEKAKADMKKLIGG